MNKDIKAAAKEVFERYPNAKKVFVTPDNQVFLAEDRAKLHNEDVVSVKRNEVIEEVKTDVTDKKGAPKKADELIAEIPTYTVEQLNALEDSGEKRATVLKAVNERREAISKEIEVNTQNQG